MVYRYIVPQSSVFLFLQSDTFRQQIIKVLAYKKKITYNIFIKAMKVWNTGAISKEGFF